MQGAGEGGWVDRGLPGVTFPPAGVVQGSECFSLLEPKDAQSPGAENH